MVAAGWERGAEACLRGWRTISWRLPGAGGTRSCCASNTPALVGEDGGLIAGRARILAARQLGIAEIPVMVAAGWTEAQKRAYVLADNQLAIAVLHCNPADAAQPPPI